MDHTQNMLAFRLNKRREHFEKIRNGYANKLHVEEEEKLCRVIRAYIKQNGVQDEVDFVANFPDIIRPLKTSLGRDLELTYVYQQYEVLRDRYRSFKYILKQPNVVYNESTNRVTVPRAVRALAQQKWPLAGNYLVYGDPSWSLLQSVFTPLGDLEPYIGENLEEDMQREKLFNDTLEQIRKDKEGASSSGGTGWRRT